MARGSPGLPALAALLGGLFAAWLYGTRVLDPASAAWLLQGDAAQHYMGSVFFRSAPWQWPPGLFQHYGEQPTSVVFTDAIPLLAFPAKALGLAPGWQYFGLWMLACHALSAWFAVRLLRRIGLTSGFGVVAGALFFAAAPALLLRAYGHESLMAHFLVLAALDRALAPWRWTPWLALAAVAVLVHPYLAVMVCALGLARAAAALAERETTLFRLAALGAVSAVVLATIAWMAGYVGTASQFTAGGFNHFSANMLTWLDPMDWEAFVNRYGMQAPYAREWSRWLPPLAQATVGQYEGFAYLGAGMLALGALAVLASLAGRGAALADVAPIPRVRWVGVWLAVGSLALLALSAKPSLGPWFIANVPVGERGYRLLSVFRASGRFIWPLTYLVMALALCRVARLPRGSALIGFALLLQVSDLLPKFKEFRTRFREGPPALDSLVADPLWPRVLARCPRLELVSTHTGGSVGPAVAAGLAGATFTPAHTARPSPEAEAARQQAAAARLAANEWRLDTVYLLMPPLPGALPIEQVLERLPSQMEHRRLDGRDVVLPRPCLDP